MCVRAHSLCAKLRCCVVCVCVERETNLGLCLDIRVFLHVLRLCLLSGVFKPEFVVQRMLLRRRQELRASDRVRRRSGAVSVMSGEGG